MKRPRRARIAVEILIQAPQWRTAGNVRAVIRRALNAAAEALELDAAEIAVLLTDDAAIQILNRGWRGFDKPTNVLSFPAAEMSASERFIAGEHLGDIVIAYETMAREAKADRKSFGDHLSHMAVHGLLHLAGFDHAKAREATRMENREREILATLGIADPYAETIVKPVRRKTARPVKTAARNSR